MKLAAQHIAANECKLGDHRMLSLGKLMHVAKADEQQAHRTRAELKWVGSERNDILTLGELAATPRALSNRTSAVGTDDELRLFVANIPPANMVFLDPSPHDVGFLAPSSDDRSWQELVRLPVERVKGDYIHSKEVQ